jgi:hypothetical protein
LHRSHELAVRAPGADAPRRGLSSLCTRVGRICPTPAEIDTWRPTIAERHGHQTIAALRLVFAYAIRLEMLDENRASAVKNPLPQRPEIKPFAS